MSDPAKGAKWDQFGAQYDFPPFSGQPRTYLIASTGRSGSHYLAHLLFRTGLVGSPLEYMHPRHLARWKTELNAQSPTEVFRALRARRTGPTGWFGLKAHWPQFSKLASDSETMDMLGEMRFVRLDRTDRVAQAVSMEIARQSGSWISYHGEGAPVAYDFERIRTAIGALARESRNWDIYFQQVGVTPLALSYEDLVAAPGATVGKVLGHLEVTAQIGAADPTQGPQRQSTPLNQEWCDRFRDDAARQQDPS